MNFAEVPHAGLGRLELFNGWLLVLVFFFAFFLAFVASWLLALGLLPFVVS